MSKKKKDPMMLEARDVLLNRIVIDKDGHFTTTSELRFPLWGVPDGSQNLRLWGLTTKHFKYNTDSENNTKAVYRAKTAMSTIGRGINLHCNPDAASCLIKTYVFYPVVIAFYENEDKELTLSVFTPRSLTARVAVRLAVLKFDKATSDSLTRIIDKKDLTTRIDEFRNKPKEEKIAAIKSFKLFKRKKKSRDGEPEEEVDTATDFFAMDTPEKQEEHPEEEGLSRKEKRARRKLEKLERERRKLEAELNGEEYIEPEKPSKKKSKTDIDEEDEDEITAEEMGDIDWSVD
ncbi:MAG: hypothetical protein J6I58_01835 [Eubacterium sp.]|nr:hypothetical protein [Eubacterium sp.]MBR1773686.1 hypothetical protein [Eubacterium sp.]